MLAKSVLNPLPATFLRGGTSKGIFLNRKHLPADTSQWPPIFLGIMGSPDPEHGRQLNGMGGGVSSLSKICVVGEPSEQLRADGIDVDYTFCQVGIRDESLDYSGNCGNLSSMVGVFAIDQRMCKPRTRVSESGHRLCTVRSYNTNTGKRIDTTFPISQGRDAFHMPHLSLPQTSIAGVPGLASRIDLDFVSPGGARTGKLLPTGNPVNTTDIIHPVPMSSEFTMRMSLVDATNPTVIVSSEDLARVLNIPQTRLPAIPYGEPSTDQVLEATRQHGAKLMGLDPSAQAQPKIVILSPAAKDDVDKADIVAHALSMGVLHKAIPMTVGLCLGVAAQIPNTLAWEVVMKSRASRGDAVTPSKGGLVKIRHPGGVVEVGAEFASDGKVKTAKVVRTGRRLMKGDVWW
ncbi:DUF453-domain-containing protein [Rickenella mellea]|uniref:DUF453-domain-containing protein n=1 Tax=Rickenella mellea TaxID=50990 RepID=A0A4R5XEA5_9AGAM|nr:DUF453-domain-containing protein [Rickenella mellea]